MGKSTSTVEPAPLDRPLDLALDSLANLQVFALPFDSKGEIKVRLSFAFPEADKRLAALKFSQGNRGLVKIKKSPSLIEIETRKIWGLSFDFFRKHFGAVLAEMLKGPPEGTVLTIAFEHKKGTQIYRGTVRGDDWRIEAMDPIVANDVFAAAWKTAEARFDKSITCADPAEADAIAAAVDKDKFLRSMGVKRNGLKFNCAHDEGQLAALLFHHRFGEHWKFPGLESKKRPRLDAMELATEKWKKDAKPTDSALAHFETIRKLLADAAKTGAFKTRTQEFPPKETYFLPAKKGDHEWEFASIAAVGNDAYFDLYPLGLDVLLRDRVSKQLRTMSYRTDDGFKIPGKEALPEDEIRELIAASAHWFKTEIAAAKPLPPCQAIDQYLIEPVDWLSDPAAEKEPGFDSFARAATYHPLGDHEKTLLTRLDKALGHGTWRRGELEISGLLPGWEKACRLELHWYDRNAKKGGREAWKIKRFGKGSPKEMSCDVKLIYAAKSDFTASLETGKTYRCTATLGKKFQAYVRIIDESGDEYWYPERFFISTPSTKT